MPTKTRLLFRGEARALVSHSLKMMKRIQAYDAAQAAKQTATGTPGNFIQFSPQIKAAVNLMVSVLTAELGARG